MWSVASAILGFVSRAFGLVTSWFTFAERQQDIRAGRDQQTAADERETIAAQQRELGVAEPTSDDVARRARDGTF